MSEQRVNQAVAIERQIKGRINKELAEVHHLLQKAPVFDGMIRTYRPVVDGGAPMPAENKKVQHRAPDLVSTAVKNFVELFDATAARDWGNINAKADVKIGGETLLKDVPVTFLMFLEKQLVEVRTLISKLPTLDPAETWALNENDKLWKTGKVEKARTQKSPRVILKRPETPEHPAQTELIYEDMTVGFWEETRLSAAYPQAEQKRLLDKVEALQVVVKKAREAANLAPAPDQEVGAKIFDWLLK